MVARLPGHARAWIVVDPFQWVTIQGLQSSLKTAEYNLPVYVHLSSGAYGLVTADDQF
jgi:hypothetical protein